jgi:hypothetical protein
MGFGPWLGLKREHRYFRYLTMTKQSTTLTTPMSKKVAENWRTTIAKALKAFPEGMFTVEACPSFERENAYGISLESIGIMRQKWCDTEAECQTVLNHLTSKPEKARFVFDLQPKQPN